MVRFEPGIWIGIPADVTTGAFPREILVTFETIRGPISGFVSPDQIVEKDGQKFIRGLIKEVSDESLTVLVSGSFFTTTGIAYLSKNAELTPVAA